MFRADKINYRIFCTKKGHRTFISTGARTIKGVRYCSGLLDGTFIDIRRDNLFVPKKVKA